MGSVNLDNTGSGSAITLSSDGTSLLLNGTAIGGGGDPDLYRDNASSPTTPVASAVNGVAIGNGASSAGSNSSGVAIGFNATVGAGTGGVAIGESYVGNSDAVAFAMNSTSSSYGALGARSVAGAGLAKASGSGSIALGYGSQSTNSISVAIGQNATATAANALALGYNSSATTADSISLGGSATSVKVSGAYTLPTADGTNGQVLTTDGSGAVTFADAGGGNPDLYRDNAVNATTPTAAGDNGIAIGSNAVNTTTHGSKNGLAVGTNAVADYWATALGAGTDATGNSSLAVGYNSQATGSKSTAIMNSYASGTAAFAAVIDNNTSSYGATGANSVAMGYQCKSSANSSSVALGRQSIASANYACAIGNGATASAANAFAFCDSATASGFRSVALGRSSTQGISGKHSRGAYIFSSVGDAQEGKYVLLSDTTDATAEALTTTNGAASATNQVVLPNNSAFAFHGTIVARQQAAGGTACAAWKVEGLIRREGSAGTTVLVNSATTVLDNTPNWGMALSADTTNGCLKIEVTGAAATNIRWVATIHTSEVTYA